MTDQEVFEAALNKMRMSCKTSIQYLCNVILDFKDVNVRTHGEIIGALESSDTRKLICVPRGCLKSSLACVAYPIWLLINNPNLRILLDSELYSNSKNFLREIKAHMESQIMVKLFGEFKGEVWNESEIIINQRTQIKKEASITVSGIGAVKVGQHFDVIIGDDYNSPQNSNTPESAQKVINHYKMNTSILEPTGIYAIIGTRYSESDLIGHILNHEVNPKTEEAA